MEKRLIVWYQFLLLALLFFEVISFLWLVMQSLDVLHLKSRCCFCTCLFPVRSVRCCFCCWWSLDPLEQLFAEYLKTYNHSCRMPQEIMCFMSHLRHANIFLLWKSNNTTNRPTSKVSNWEHQLLLRFRQRHAPFKGPLKIGAKKTDVVGSLRFPSVGEDCKLQSAEKSWMHNSHYYTFQTSPNSSWKNLNSSTFIHRVFALLDRQGKETTVTISCTFYTSSHIAMSCDKAWK